MILLFVFKCIQPLCEFQYIADCLFILHNMQMICISAANKRIDLFDADTLKNQTGCFIGSLRTAAAALRKNDSSAFCLHRQRFMPEYQS